MVVRVLCVRHGLSTWNREGRWQGRADPPLTEDGRAGAAELAAALAVTLGSGRRVALWTSNLQRAVETAEIIADRLGSPVVIDPRLAETDVGPWQGLTSRQIERRWPGFLADGRRPEGFEADATLLGRVVPALADIAAGAGPGVMPIVVAHAGVLRAVRRHAGASDERLANLGGLWFTVEPASTVIRFGGVFRPGPDHDTSIEPPPVGPAAGPL